MSEVNAETISVLAAEEASQGTIPSTGWFAIEANSLSGTEATYTKQSRNPFSPSRQLRRPFISGLDVTLSMELDVTLDHILAFAEAIYKSEWKESGGVSQFLFRPSAVVADGFTVPSNGAVADGTLVVGIGFTNSANNGLHVCSSAGATKIAVTSPLVAETPPANAIVLIVGHQFTSGDLKLDSDGNLTTSTKDLTTLGLNKGQVVYLGGSDEIDPPYRFANTDYYGYAKIAATPSTNKLTLERRSWEVGSADEGTGKTIRLFYTAWIRNVSRGHADENLVSHSFEIAYPGLANGSTAYRYKTGCMLNTCAFAMPAEGKMTMQLEFIGRQTTDPSTSRETGPSSARDVVSELAISTSADVNRLYVEEVDETGMMTDFADITLTVNNNISAADAVGYMGNRFTPIGAFQVDTAATVYITTEDVASAVSENRVLRLSAGARNTEFGIFIDVPSVGELAAPETIEHNQLVTVNASIQGFIDRNEGYTSGLSLFGYLPTLAPGLET